MEQIISSSREGEKGRDTMGLFGSGNKITLTLEKYEYNPGETIKGKVSIKLKKPTTARKLEVALIGTKIEKYRTTRTYGTTGHRRSRPDVSESQEIIYNQSVPLGEEKEYLEEEHTFEINIPGDIFSENNLPKGRFGGSCANH